MMTRLPRGRQLRRLRRAARPTAAHREGRSRGAGRRRPRRRAGVSAAARVSPRPATAPRRSSASARKRPRLLGGALSSVFCDDLIVCTDDGSYGKAACHQRAARRCSRRDRPDLVVAIGPLPMMSACVETTRPFGVKTMVSLNAIMVDGTGMCGSCRVHRRRRGASSPASRGRTSTATRSTSRS